MNSLPQTDSEGTERWWKDGELHRDDGPAVIWTDGDVEWWIYFIRYTFEEWCHELDISEREKLYLQLKYI